MGHDFFNGVLLHRERGFVHLETEADTGGKQRVIKETMGAATRERRCLHHPDDPALNCHYDQADRQLFGAVERRIMTLGGHVTASESNPSTQATDPLTLTKSKSTEMADLETQTHEDVEAWLNARLHSVCSCEDSHGAKFKEWTSQQVVDWMASQLSSSCEQATPGYSELGILEPEPEPECQPT